MDFLKDLIKILQSIRGGALPLNNRVKFKHDIAKLNYGRKPSKVRQENLKEEIRQRLCAEFKYGWIDTKPRVRYKLRTVVTQYCGYRYVEWK